MKNTTNHYDVIVIGGGASGLMAAGRAAELGKSVLLLEKNPTLGNKLKITGGGRCNITNAEEDIHVFMKNYGKAAPFLYSPFAKFSVKDTFTFFKKLNLPLVIQARKRVFPATEKALDVFKAMERYIKMGKVTVLTSTKVSRINHTSNSVSSVLAGGVTYTASGYIVATGGLSHPETGSTGDGFNWLKALGHTVADPTPTIVPIATKEKWGHALSGTPLTFMKITFYVDGKKSFSKTGKLLFTHFGLSGPLILNSASTVGDLLHVGHVTARIDAYPDTDMPALEDKIIKIFDANKNKMFKNILDDIVPHGMSKVVGDIVPEINIDTKVHSITKDQRKILIERLKGLPVTIIGLLGNDQAVVTDGGIPLTEIDNKTMRSTILNNLFITGDLLHINRPSGGYSLQLCWTTGYLAGENA